MSIKAIEPTGISLWCFLFRRVWPGRLMASVLCRMKRETNGIIIKPKEKPTRKKPAEY